MSQWSIKVEKFKDVVFEVLETSSAWEQFGRIKASPAREYRLGGHVGSQVRVGFSAGDSIVSFVPHSRDASGQVRESVLRCFNDTSASQCWEIRVEAGEGVDYDDYVVCVSVVDAPAEAVAAFQASLDGLDFDRPVIE